MLALYYGPTPVSQGIRRATTLLTDAAMERAGRANVLTFLAGLVAQEGDFERARQLNREGREIYEGLGQLGAMAAYSGLIAADIERLATDASATVRIMRELCEDLEQRRDYNHLASRAGDLADALYTTGSLEEADRWAQVAEHHAARDDVGAQLAWRSVRAKIMARSGDVAAANAFVLSAVELSETSDSLNRRAKVQSDLGEILLLAENTEEAAAALDRAVKLYEQKGNRVSAARLREGRGEVALV
jgi:tetratricopeptide (TPR) repeat protein